MSARSKRLVGMVVRSGDINRKYELEEQRWILDPKNELEEHRRTSDPENELEQQRQASDLENELVGQRQTLDAENNLDEQRKTLDPENELEEQSRTSDLDEAQEYEVKQVTQMIGDIFSDDDIPESDQESLQINLLPPRRISETSSSESLFSGHFSDNDPSYYPDQIQRPSSSEDDLVTLQDLLDSNVSDNIASSLMSPQPCTSRQSKKVNDDNASEIATIVLTDILELVWDQVKTINRWRTPNPKSWKKNIAKKRRADGLPYSTSNKKRAPKVPKVVNCNKCTFKCTDIFTDECREKICRMYWNLDYVGKKNFLLSCLIIQPLKRVAVNRKRAVRQFSTKCFLNLGVEKKQVCQKFFCSTLAITYSVLNDAIKHRDELGFYAGADKRGHCVPPNKTPTEKVQEVVDHINSFPSIEGHYIKKQSKRRYLDSTLSINKMYELYSQKYENPVSQITYRRIFSTQFNLSFFVPKKDQCRVCNKYNSAQGEDKLQLEMSYAEHIERKIACEIEKEKDKQKAGSDHTFLSASFDLQAILQIPCTKVGLLYYVRKLTVYNLTVYESALSNNAYCFPWSEVHGKKGSAEIGTILLYYLSNCIPKNVTSVSLFSDTAGGQNRNQNITAILYWAVNKIDHLLEIEQKFLESGHSYMEADSMHSSIESAKKYKDIFSMTEWKNIFKSARSKRIYKVGKEKVKKDPYNVKEFKYNEFLDLKQLAESTLKNKTKDCNGDRVNWLKIKKLKFIKGDTKIYFNYDVSDSYLNFDVRATLTTCKTTTPQSGRSRYSTRKGTRQRTELPRNPEIGEEFPELKHLYEAPLAISTAKKKDLINLCNKGVIPEEYHGWFQGLKSENAIIDRLPDVAVSETSEEEE